MRIRYITLEIICVLFFILFLYTGLSKIIDMDRFRWAMGKSPLLKYYSAWMPYLIIALELIAAGMLLWPKTRLAALYTSTGLMGLFTAYTICILYLSKYSHHLPCSCGGVIQQMNWNQHLVFNLIFLGLAWVGIILYDRQHANSKYLLQQ